MLANKVNISIIARELNISATTVSRAISGNGRVSEKTKQKIREYLKEKQLIPNIRERRYTDISTKIITVTIPEEKELAYLPYFQKILLSVYDYFTAREYQIVPVRISADDIENLKTAVKNHVMDGVVISRRSDTIHEINFLKEQGVPFVVIGGIEDQDILQVEEDEERASFDLTNELLRLGNYRMAVMGGSEKHPASLKRYNGIMAAHVENYMVLNRDFVFFDTDKSDAAEHAVEKCLSANLDCILCMDDNICLHVLNILEKKQVRIPQQIRIASLYKDRTMSLLPDSVTCVSYDPEILGKEASRLLYTHLTEQKKMSKTIIGYEIQMHESTS